VDVLKQFLAVDRIHLFAFSRGGIMALWTAILRDDITSTVTWSGVSDIILTYEERHDMRRMMKRVIGGSPNTNPVAYDNRQPFAYIKDIMCSLLIIHGKKDVNVGIEHASRLEEALVKEEKVFETWYFSEYDHFFPSEINKQIISDLTLWMKQQGGASS
jgi:dipeptidyl aminopeptidase/acylaminoacyl peptidase